MKYRDIIKHNSTWTSLAIIDLDYIASRISHNRFIESEMGVTDLLTSRLCEAGKTMVYALQTLMLGKLEVLDIDISIDTEARLTKCVSHIAHSNIIISFSYLADEDLNKPSEYKLAFLVESPNTSELLEVIHYPENAHHIMSYDMTFPPPSQFIDMVKKMLSKIMDSPDL
jgi:hypothetical protein